MPRTHSQCMAMDTSTPVSTFRVSLGVDYNRTTVSWGHLELAAIQHASHQPKECHLRAMHNYKNSSHVREAGSEGCEYSALATRLAGGRASLGTWEGPRGHLTHRTYDGLNSGAHGFRGGFGLEELAPCPGLVTPMAKGPSESLTQRKVKDTQARVLPAHPSPPQAAPQLPGPFRVLSMPRSGPCSTRHLSSPTQGQQGGQGSWGVPRAPHSTWHTAGLGTCLSHKLRPTSSPCSPFPQRRPGARDVALGLLAPWSSR